MTVDDYLELPYPITLVLEPPVEGRGPIWFAKVEDLPYCSSQGDTAEEAIATLRKAMRLWIEDALESGDPVPVPRAEEEYSGRFLVRTPRSLHARLAREAQREGISLNQFVASALAGAVGWRTARTNPSPPAHTAIVEPPVAIREHTRSGLTKQELAEEVADKADIDQSTARKAIAAALSIDITQSPVREAIAAAREAITEELYREGKMSLAGFRKFSVSERSVREGRNPATGKTIQTRPAKTIQTRRAGPRSSPTASRHPRAPRTPRP